MNEDIKAVIPPAGRNKANATPRDFQKTPFAAYGKINQANRLLGRMGSRMKIGNLMNPALRQSVFDTRNLQDNS